jgi:hypothetical protein
MGNFDIVLTLGTPSLQSLEHNHVHTIAARFDEAKL